MDFISRTLAYAPERRVKPLEGCAHSFFDELRDEKTRLPPGKPLPPLFDFTAHELSSRPEVLENLIPSHLNDKMKADSSSSSNIGGSDVSSSAGTGGVGNKMGEAKTSAARKS